MLARKPQRKRFNGPRYTNNKEATLQHDIYAGRKSRFDLLANHEDNNEDKEIAKPVNEDIISGPMTGLVENEMLENLGQAQCEKKQKIAKQAKRNSKSNGLARGVSNVDKPHATATKERSKRAEGKESEKGKEKVIEK